MKILLFENVHRMMQAEKLLKEKEITCEVLPTPKKYSLECGMCIAIDNDLVEACTKVLGVHPYRLVDDPRKQAHDR